MTKTDPRDVGLRASQRPYRSVLGRWMQLAAEVELATLSWRDAAEIGLQRTEHLVRLPGLGSPSCRLWRGQRPGLLHAEAWLRQHAILEGVIADLAAEFQVLERFLGEGPVGRMVDIGLWSCPDRPVLL